MNRLIDQLLMLARGDAGVEAINHQRLDLSNLVLATIHAMQPLADESEIRLAVELTQRADMTIHATGDETQLKRVLVNLIENAIRHTEPGGEIRVSVERTGSGIECRVRDTGCGIPEAHLPHIFDRFYRVDKTRSRQSGGSGLGLAICRQIVEAHGGTISAESQMDVGTTFVIVLPAD